MLRRLVQTSTGWAEIGLARTPWYGTQVSVRPFDADGWARLEETWGDKRGDRGRGETLPAFLASMLDLPGAEAAELAETILGPWLREWEERGGAAETKQVVRLTYVLGIAIPVVLVVALAGVAVVLWLMLT